MGFYITLVVAAAVAMTASGLPRSELGLLLGLTLVLAAWFAAAASLGLIRRLHISDRLAYFALARIHRRTPMDGVRTAEGGG